MYFFTGDPLRIPSRLTNSCDPQLIKPAAANRLTARNTLFAKKIIGAPKKFKNGTVHFLGLKLTIHVIKSQKTPSRETVPLTGKSVRLSLFCRMVLILSDLRKEKGNLAHLPI